VRRPLVSIGLPVFNGEAYLDEAIRSVLAQSLADLELVISDNASTDRTAEICRGWAATDRRVRYLRNPTNLGAAPNYNRTFAESRGRYFKWLAHDDRLRSEYLATTVAVLEADPSVVLCNTTVDYIDGRGVLIGQYRSPLGLAAAERPSERFAALVLHSHSCVVFFGRSVARRSKGLCCAVPSTEPTGRSSPSSPCAAAWSSSRSRSSRCASTRNATPAASAAERLGKRGTRPRRPAGRSPPSSSIEPIAASSRPSR